MRLASTSDRIAALSGGTALQCALPRFCKRPVVGYLCRQLQFGLKYFLGSGVAIVLILALQVGTAAIATVSLAAATRCVVAFVHVCSL
jgi:hypothetical protein